MSEAKFVADIIENFTALDPDIHISEVESHISSPGIPDLDICSQGKEFHLEIKHSDNGVMPLIRPTQARWFKDRVKAGAMPWVLAKILDKNSGQWLIMLIPGHMVHMIARSGSIDAWAAIATIIYTGEEMELGGWDSILNYVKKRA